MAASAFFFGLCIKLLVLFAYAPIGAPGRPIPYIFVILIYGN